MNAEVAIDPEAVNPRDDRRAGELECPHCLTMGFRRSSQRITCTFRAIFYVCPNPLCGHTWKGSLSYDYGLSPSAIPDPAVNLPMRTIDREAAMIARNGPAPPDPNQPTFFD